MEDTKTNTCNDCAFCTKDLDTAGCAVFGDLIELTDEACMSFQKIEKD